MSEPGGGIELVHDRADWSDGLVEATTSGSPVPGALRPFGGAILLFTQKAFA